MKSCTIFYNNNVEQHSYIIINIRSATREFNLPVSPFVTITNRPPRQH